MLFKRVFVVALFASLGCLVHADLPMHCLREEVAGEWTFDLGPNDGSKDMDCRTFKPVAQLKVRLALPFRAEEIDEDGTTIGQVGRWTMVYDEAWEVQVNGRKFFSFSKYTQEKGAAGWNITSLCHQTLNGWFHNDDGTAWGCYNGTRSGAPAIRYGHGDPNFKDFSDAPMGDQAAERGADVGGADLLEVPHDSPTYKPETTLIEEVNRRKLSWSAKTYPQFDKLTMRELKQRMGFGHIPSEFKQALQKQPTGRVDDVDMLLLQMAEKHASKAAGAGAGAGTGATTGKGKNVPIDDTLFTTRKHIDDYPATWDWRNMNGQDFTHPAVDQGGCGSCWAVSTADMLSMRVAIATNNTWKPKLSAQEMLVCSDKYAQGCEGGFPYLALKFAQDYGLGDSQCYPYQGVDQKCQLAQLTSQKPDQCSAKTRITVENYQYLGGGYGAGSAEAMLEELYTNGPITVCFEPSGALMHYAKGVFEEEEELEALQVNPWEKVDHAVVIVGWSTGTHGKKYWIVKNSWGSYWGDEGYFYLEVGKNTMSIESMATAAKIQLPAQYRAV